ncbi:hypothetical protein [Georgenia alba]|uniref:DUF1616 domain-containing protein n=1 Tax=Georgenia alba TaxID=2233858 RepID=A0ABW2Q4Q4_9MICO
MSAAAPRPADLAPGPAVDRPGEAPRHVTLALLVVTLATVALSVTDGPPSARLPLLLVFVCTAPGWVLFARAQDPAPRRWTVVIAASVAISILLAMVMLLTNWWEPAAVMLALEVLTAVGLVIRLARRRDRRSGDTS